jgi:hypothetical protein
LRAFYLCYIFYFLRISLVSQFYILYIIFYCSLAESFLHVSLFHGAWPQLVLHIFWFFTQAFGAYRALFSIPWPLEMARLDYVHILTPVVDMHRPFGQVYKVANEFRELAGGERDSITDIRGRGVC